MTDRLTTLPNGRFQIHAHAKLNLGLRVSPARPDGFHNLETWMLPISWHDTLAFDPIDQPLTLQITGRSNGIPTDLHQNLIGRAALTLATAAGIEPRGKITLHKTLPPGGGIGGGSSDAAAALLALNHAWNLHLPPERLEQLAATLGSDIPFFIRSRPSLCTGRGEIMTPLAPLHPLFAVLIIPPLGCPTKDVYQAFDAGHQHHPAKPPTDWPACARATAEELNTLLINDLEPAAFHIAPALANLRTKSAQLLAQPIHLTGSGSTLFALCSSGTQASLLADRLNATLTGSATCVPVRLG